MNHMPAIQASCTHVHVQFVKHQHTHVHVRVRVYKYTVVPYIEAQCVRVCTNRGSTIISHIVVFL